jgi:hypothetical protein
MPGWACRIHFKFKRCVQVNLTFAGGGTALAAEQRRPLAARRAAPPAALRQVLACATLRRQHMRSAPAYRSLTFCGVSATSWKSAKSATSPTKPDCGQLDLPMYRPARGLVSTSV